MQTVRLITRSSSRRVFIRIFGIGQTHLCQNNGDDNNNNNNNRGDKALSSSLRRTFSSVGTPDTDAGSEVGPLPLTKQPARPIFPWRHENAKNMLNRMQPGTKEYEALVPLPAPQEPFAFLFLGVPFWDAVLFGAWKEELAESMSYAFMQGVAGIISNVYRIPFENSGILQDDESLKFHLNIEEEHKINKADDPKLFCPQVEDMLDRPLRRLFESAHESGRNQLRILLETKPFKSYFYRMYCIPFHTRGVLEDHPEILRKMYNNGKPEWSTLYGMMEARSHEQLLRYEYVETTVAAEVYILCEEKFQVLDAETGVVLQGSEGVPVTEMVGHVVTFEMTSTNRITDTFPYMKTEPGNWKIIDIDDLVSVKKWYHVP